MEHFCSVDWSCNTASTNLPTLQPMQPLSNVPTNLGDKRDWGETYLDNIGKANKYKGIILVKESGQEITLQTRCDEWQQLEGKDLYQPMYEISTFINFMHELT